MKTFLCSVLCLAGVSAALAADPAPATNLSAAQVVAKNAEARGGLEAWRAVNAMTVSGEMDAGGKQETMLPYVLTMKRPNLTRLEITFQKQVALQVYDGKQGWKLRPFLGRNDVEPYKPAELQAAAAVGELDGPLIDAARKGTRFDLQGIETVEGKPAYKLKLTPKLGEPSNLWIDAASFLDVKADGVPRRLDGKMHKVSIFYRDYKKIGNLMVAHTQETAIEGVKGTHKMTVNSVSLNPKLDASTFAKPQPAKAAAL